MKRHDTYARRSKSLEICKRIYDEILLSLGKETLGNNELNNGLFNGNWGKLLFLFYYERYCDNSQSKASVYLETLYDSMDVSSANFTFCTGLSGAFWVLNHLHKNNFIELDIDEISSDFVDIAIEYSKNYLNADNFDFLHGSSGICNLLTEFADKENVREHLSFFVKKLHKIAVETEAGLSFPIYHHHTDPPSERGVDAFGLAHGTCSYQIILLKIYQLGIEKELCKKVIEGSMQFILHHEIKNRGNTHALFPSFLDGVKASSRVSWCYGDLNVATALWRCGNYFNNTDWYEKAISIYRHNTQRNTCELAGVVDACICHGTSGNALIYWRMWKESGEIQFKKCAEDWYHLTYDILEFSPDEPGVKMWNGKDGGWKFKWELLEGSVGVGLALIDEYVDEALPWDEMLLLS